MDTSHCQNKKRRPAVLVCLRRLLCWAAVKSALHPNKKKIMADMKAPYPRAVAFIVPKFYAGHTRIRVYAAHRRANRYRVEKSSDAEKITAAATLMGSMKGTQDEVPCKKWRRLS